MKKQNRLKTKFSLDYCEWYFKLKDVIERSPTKQLY